MGAATPVPPDVEAARRGPPVVEELAFLEFFVRRTRFSVALSVVGLVLSSANAPQDRGALRIDRMVEICAAVSRYGGELRTQGGYGHVGVACLEPLNEVLSEYRCRQLARRLFD